MDLGDGWSVRTTKLIGREGGATEEYINGLAKVDESEAKALEHGDGESDTSARGRELID